MFLTDRYVVYVVYVFLTDIHVVLYVSALIYTDHP